MSDIVERARLEAKGLRDDKVFHGVFERDNAKFLEEIADEIERLRAALAFYASEDNWADPSKIYGSQVLADEGEIAREALAR